MWSLESLRRWLKEKAGVTDTATLKQYVDMLPPALTRRFVSAEQDAVVNDGAPVGPDNMAHAHSAQGPDLGRRALVAGQVFLAEVLQLVGGQ